MKQRWSIGSVELHRVRYFDTAIPAETLGLEGAEAFPWAGPWLADGQPAVGQAFWVVESGDRALIVDPCGASDPFLRSGPDAVGHQAAAFAALEAAGCDAAAVDAVVLTHLDGIGMAALADGGEPGEEGWSAAFPSAELVVSQDEYDYIAASDDLMGTAAFKALDQLGVVTTVSTPHELASGVTLRQTGAHTPGHCVVEIGSEGDRAVLLGHLAVSPLHAGGPGFLHVDADAAWTELRALLDAAHRDGALVAGSLWPTPGVARVTNTEPYELTPA